MPAIPDRPGALIELVPAAPDQESIIANLLELYAHDFSEFHHLELGSDGRFGYKHLSLYWSQPGRYPFLVRADGRLVGLVLVKRGAGVAQNGVVWDVVEFFIVRAYRRHGIGTKAAFKVWERFPGRWEVRVMQANRKALDFWQRVIADFIGAAIDPVPIEEDGERWHVFQFESTPVVKK